jgi:hypothetical protein
LTSFAPNCLALDDHGESSIAAEWGPPSPGTGRSTVPGAELGRIAILLIAAQASSIWRAMIRLKLVHGTLTALCQVKKFSFLGKFNIRLSDHGEYFDQFWLMP